MAALIFETHSPIEDAASDPLFQFSLARYGLGFLAENGSQAGPANKGWNKRSSCHVVYSINGLRTLDGRRLRLGARDA